MTEHIQEFVNSRGHDLRVDRATGVLRGVKLLGLASRNGRRYRETALAEAIGLYEGAKVNVNHPKGHPHAPRDYQERLGVIRNVALRPSDGLFGNLHYNPKHPLAEQLAWDAEHSPENVGLSHNVEARTSRAGEETMVEAIVRVQSVDLVADPATTRGLFEQEEGGRMQEAGGREEAAQPQSPPTLPAAGCPLPATEELAALREQLAAYKRQKRIRELLLEHDLPLPHECDPQARRLTSPAFLEALEAATDDATLRKLVEDRAAAVKREAQSFAQSREQTSTATTVSTAADFARALKKKVVSR
jgi:hypothetical protein